MSSSPLVGARSALDQRSVHVGAPVAVEGPLVADLLEQIHVEVADDQLLFVGAGDVADELAPRADEVRLSVEVVVAERLDADAVDGADVVLVGDGGGRLLELPQVGAQPTRTSPTG